MGIEWWKDALLAYSTLHTRLSGVLEGGGISLSNYRNRSKERANKLFDILLFDIAPLRELGVPPEAVDLFLVHCLLLPTLTVRERAQIPQFPCQDLVDVLRDNLSPFF